MHTKNTDLTALLGSRICHDLISPLGAIGNGIELLQMGGALDGPEMALISDSVAHANARLRYFRVAFGAASEGQLQNNDELRDILENASGSPRLRVHWPVTSDQLRTDVKLAFLLIQCLETAMPYGGEIAITKNGEDWRIQGQAEKIKIDTDLWRRLSKPNDESPLLPAQVHFALVPDALRAAGRKLSAELRETEIVVTF
ncbi:histidine phosphotransferase family protein [Falsihalocynthiibacter sp. SS001]|uniref:histidine phosphotransferase family protein n=1 Tax=Falsihalocynthiibacter sp. SS001 TaxID=3349698 RepID=UPI0036D30C8E